MRSYRLLFLAPIAAIVARPAYAQDGVAMDMTGMGIYAMEDSMMESARETVDRTARRADPPRQTAAVELGYRPLMAVRKKNMAQFVAKLRARSPAGAAEVERMFASTDVIAEMGKVIAPVGLRVDNVADAFTVWWVNAWLASRGRDDEPTRAQVAAVRRQAAETFASNAEFARADNALKQEVAEANLVQAAMIASMMQGAKGNAAHKREIAKQVRIGARASGMDLDAIELTDAGFVPARRTGAADAVPPAASDEAPVALAATAPVTGEESSGGRYVLLAAAGGAALTAAYVALRRGGRG